MHASVQAESLQTAKQAQKTNAGLRSPLVVFLGALLALQLLAAVILGTGGSDLSPAASQGPLLAFEDARVSRLVIASDAGELTLEKTDQGWQLPSLGGFPASQFKVSELLEKLSKIQKRIPVATSETALTRFKVADEDFERRLTLEGADGTLGTLYLGDSPGFRRLFVRSGGDPAVYEAELALFDASDKADDWTEKTALHLERERIKGVKTGDATLIRGGDGTWSLADLGEDEKQDQDAVNDLLRRIANLNFRGVLGSENNPEYGQDAPALRFTVTLEDKSLDYVLSKHADSEDYVLKVSDRPYYFRLSRYDAEDLTQSTRDTLLASDEDAAETPETDRSETD